MRNPRTALAAFVLVGALALPSGTAASGASAPAAPAPAPVVAANASVLEAIQEIGAVHRQGTIEVVKVDHASLSGLVQDRRFLDNVHVLQDFLHNNDAGVLKGADVAITELLAVDVEADGDVVIFTR